VTYETQAVNLRLTCQIVWLQNNTISKLVIVISSTETLEVLERWHFDIQVNGENGLPMAENVPPAE
jgi:mitotic spindle assembly checkpoint protein MAD2